MINQLLVEKLLKWKYNEDIINNFIFEEENQIWQRIIFVIVYKSFNNSTIKNYNFENNI